MDYKEFEELLVVEDNFHDSRFYSDLPEEKPWFGALTGYGTLEEAFQLAITMIARGCKSLYFSLDMKPNEEIGMDYIAIYYFDQRRQWNCYLIPYQDNQKLTPIKEAGTITFLLNRINQVVPLNN